MCAARAFDYRNRCRNPKTLLSLKTGPAGKCAALVKEYKDKDYDFGIDFATVELLTGLDKASAEAVVSALTRRTQSASKITQMICNLPLISEIAAS